MVEYNALNVAGEGSNPSGPAKLGNKMYVEKLKQLQEEMGVKIGGVFPGTNPNATEEEISQALYESLLRLKNGDYEVIAEIGK